MSRLGHWDDGGDGPISTHKMVPHLDVLQDTLLELESLVSLANKRGQRSKKKARSLSPTCHNITIMNKKNE